VLAKYLVIRDHPEQIETLREERAEGWVLGRRQMLVREIERLRTELAGLEGLRRRD